MRKHNTWGKFRVKYIWVEFPSCHYYVTWKRYLIFLVLRAILYNINTHNTHLVATKKGANLVVWELEEVRQWRVFWKCLFPLQHSRKDRLCNYLLYVPSLERITENNINSKQIFLMFVTFYFARSLHLQKS